MLSHFLGVFHLVRHISLSDHLNCGVFGGHDDVPAILAEVNLLGQIVLKFLFDGRNQLGFVLILVSRIGFYSRQQIAQGNTLKKKGHAFVSLKSQR